MHITQRMEQFSKAYIWALAAKTGCNISVLEVDNDSIDISLQKKYKGSSLGRLDLQLKAYGTDSFENDMFSFSLKKKNYDDLRRDEIVPRLLVIVCIPKDIESWISHSEEQLLLRRCAYWYDLAGLPESENETSVTLHIPRVNLLSPASLEEIMYKSRGEAV